MQFNITLSINLFIAVCYCYTVLKVAIDWKRIPEFKSVKQSFSTTVSIIVAARNEEKNIVNCLNSLIKQIYPNNLFEIIIVDDDSSDSTAVLVQVVSAKNGSVPIKLLKAADLNKEHRGKKTALKIGIQNSSAKLIVTTDADCIMGEQWLSGMVAFYELHHPKMIVGPVAIYDERTNFEFFQSTELLSLMGFTGAYCYRGSPIMSNGANLAYERNAFLEVGGFDGIDQVASGDDVLLMNKFADKFPGGVKFLKSKTTIVQTKAQQSFASFLHQRIRWASKGLKTMSHASIGVAIIVSSINLAILFNLVLSFFYGKFVILFLLLFVLKFIADYALLRTVSVFFSKQIQVTNIIASQLFYSLYVVLILFLGMRKQYEWKGRTVNER